MNQIVTILQEITQTAYKTQETVKTIASYPEASNIPYIYQLNILLDRIKTNSISSTFKIISEPIQTEFQENLHIMYESIASGEEIHARLKSNFPDSIPGNLKEWLDKNMQSLKKLLVKMVPHIVRIFGEKESKFIINPILQDTDDFFAEGLLAN